MTTIFDLPKYVFLPLFEWMTLSSLKQLDSSVCHRKYRPIFLAAVSSEYFSYDMLCEFPPSSDVYEWLILRNIILKSAVIDDCCNSALRLFEKKAVCNKVESLTIFPKEYILCNASSYLARFTELQSLTIQCEYTFVNDDLLLLIAASMPMLKSVNFALCYLITNEGLFHLLEHCHQIECVNFKDNNKIDDAGLYAIGNYCGSRMKSVTMSHHKGITDDGIQYMCESCKNLTHLDFVNCYLMNRECFRAMTDCVNLKSLNLDNFRLLKDRGIERMVAQCKSITSLNINMCTSLTVLAVHLIADGYPGLLHFCIRSPCHSNSIRAAVVRVVSVCPLLKTLDISQWDYLSEDEFLSIVKHGSNLEFLFCYTVLVSDEVVSLTQDTCSKLKELHLSYQYLVYCEKFQCWKVKY